MPVLDGGCFVERLRRVVGRADEEKSHAVQIMPVPSYLQDLQHDGNELLSNPKADIVLVYKANIKTSTSSLPLDVRDELNVSHDSNIELGGDPLPAPFEEEEFDVSSTSEACEWPKSELAHYPINMSDALSIFNETSDMYYGKEIPLDVWCVVSSGTSDRKVNSSTSNGLLNGSQTFASLSILEEDTSSSKIKHVVNEKILLGLQSTNGWWTRSYVETQGMCSLVDPEMDPLFMKKKHLEVAKMPEYLVDTAVLCRYSIKGQTISTDVLYHDRTPSVTLELKWKQPSLVPTDYQEARVIVQAEVGRKTSSAFGLWKQLFTLHNLLDLFYLCWSEKRTPDNLPHLDPIVDELLPIESLETRLHTLICGGKQALDAQSVSRRMSLAPAAIGRQSVSSGRKSVAPGLVGRKSIMPFAMKESCDNKKKLVSLSEALEFAVSGNRENSDVTDALFSLLLECKTYHELISAWDVVLMELREARTPYIRSKNNTRTAKIINGIVSGKMENSPDFLEGSLYPLELLIELGFEKLTTDYMYIFIDSQLAGYNELQAPQLVRAGLGTPRDKWLASCGDLLGWLAQVHSALEIILPLEGSMSSHCVPYMATRALKFYQSEMSPVRSVNFLLSPQNALQVFSFPVKTDTIRQHVNRPFDWWRLTLESKSERRKVKHVFLRSHLKAIFPPQIYEYSENLVPSENVKTYHCASLATISDCDSM